jgi:hypothetical protein
MWLKEYEPIHKHWVSRAAFPLIVLSLVLSQIAIGFSVYHGWIWLGVPAVILASHFMHGALIGFHEASHGMLRKSRLLNDIDGVLAGTLSFMSFTLYRVAHQTHHAHLGTERDEELWPFVIVDSPRWFRRLIAFIELNAGHCLHALPFRPHVSQERFVHQKSQSPPPHLGGVWNHGDLLGRSDQCRGLLECLELFCGCIWFQESSPEICRAGGNTSNTSVCAVTRRTAPPETS